MTGAGDPGSLSVTGGLLLRLGTGLSSDARRTTAAYAALRGEWVGRASVAARRRGELLAAATTRIAEESACIGAVLQRHSTDLAGLLDEEAGLRARATGAGLSVTDAGVVLAPGPRGLADAAEVASTEAVRAVLDTAWRDLQGRVRSSRATVHAALEVSSDRLSASAASLRVR